MIRDVNGENLTEVELAIKWCHNITFKNHACHPKWNGAFRSLKEPPKLISASLTLIYNLSFKLLSSPVHGGTS